DMRSYFLPNNCGKEAVTLNLGEAEGRRILRELVRALRVDVFATNQRPRSYAKLGIDDATLRAVKPDLIWLGVTGFGPDHDEAAYDPILQARAGFMELTGAPDGPPTVFGLPMVDLGAAEHGYGAIMRALYHRAVTGTGARLDVSMLRSAVSWMVSPVLLSASLGERITRTGTLHPFFAPVAVFQTRDGYVYVAVGNDAQWAALAKLRAFAGLDRPEWAANAGRIADVGRLHRELGERVARLPTAEAQALLREAGVTIARERVAPHAARYDDAEEYPEDSIRALIDAGLYGIWVPERYGGTDAGCLALALVCEEIAWACAATATQYLDQPLGGLPILRFGTEAQKTKYLPRLATGELLAAYSLSEP